MKLTEFLKPTKEKILIFLVFGILFLSGCTTQEEKLFGEPISMDLVPCSSIYGCGQGDALKISGKNYLLAQEIPEESTLAHRFPKIECSAGICLTFCGGGDCYQQENNKVFVYGGIIEGEKSKDLNLRRGYILVKPDNSADVYIPEKNPELYKVPEKEAENNYINTVITNLDYPLNNTKLLHRSIYNCEDHSIISGPQVINVHTFSGGYPNFVCRNRYESHCLMDGSFDQYYVEWCEDAEGNRIDV